MFKTNKVDSEYMISKLSKECSYYMTQISKLRVMAIREEDKNVRAKIGEIANMYKVRIQQMRDIQDALRVKDYAEAIELEKRMLA